LPAAPLQKVADWLKQLRDSGHLEPTSMIQGSNLKSACGVKWVAPPAAASRLLQQRQDDAGRPA
jgi:hypothetical protein